MELSTDQLTEIIIKAYEKGQKTGISRLTTEFHDLKHEFYRFRDEIYKGISALSDLYMRIESDLKNLKKEDSEKIQTILLELSKVVGALEVIDKRIKGELSNISTPHEAPASGSAGSGSMAEGVQPPSPDEDRDLVDIVIYRLFSNLRGKPPRRIIQMALYVYSQGGSALLSDLVRRFGAHAYNIYRSAHALKLFITRVEGGEKLVYLKDSVKKELDQILSQYRRS